jgi:predicted dehydrogenase
MRALLVGAGGMGRAWADNLTNNPDTEIIGWVDLIEGAAAASADDKGLHLEYVGTDLSAAITATKPDFIVDVSSPQGHCDVTCTALGHGVPVIGEKPMADTMAQAKRMVQASEKAGKLFMVSQSRRYDAGLVAFKGAIERELGGLGILNVDFSIGAHFGGFRAEMESPLVVDMAIHTFDGARYLSGRNAVAVFADEFNPNWSWYKGDACANALFEMEDGLRFTYRGSWTSEGLDTSWDGDWKAVGPKGSAMWEKNQEPVSETVASTSGFRSEFERKTHLKPTIAGGISGSLAEFIDALKTGATPQGECHDNLQSLAMVFAAIASNRRKERVLLEEILNV